MIYKPYLKIRIIKTIMLGSLFFFGCAKQNQKILETKSSLDFSKQEFCYINNKIISYIIESNGLFFDAEYFSMLKFDKSSSFILYQKMNDHLLKKCVKYVTDSIENSSIIQIKNRIDLLEFCNSTQMSAYYMDTDNKSEFYQLNGTSKYKCHFSISDIVQIKDKFYVFLEYSEYLNKIKEIEKSTFGFQFRICQNNNFIKFENFLELLSEMVGSQHLKLFTIKNDSVILNDKPKSDRFHKEAGFFITKIESFECD